MRKHPYILIMFAVTALAALSCQKERESTPPMESGKGTGTGNLIRLKAGIQESDLTRTSLLDQDGDRHIRWDAADEIGVVYTSGTVRGTIDPETIDGEEAYFVFAQPEGELQYAFYPYDSDATVVDHTLHVSIPSRQTYSAASVFAPGVCLMAARYDGSALRFYNACAIVEFRLTGSETLRRASLRSASRVLSGEGEIDLSAGTPVFTAASGGKHYIDLDFGEEGLTLSSTPTPVYFVLPAGTYTDLELVTEGVKGSFRAASTASHALQRNHITPMKSMAVTRSLSGTDLAAAGSANCYLLDPDRTGRFTFPARKVNGAVLKGCTADILWESEAGLVQDVLYDADRDLISFEKPAAGEGNALICLFGADRKVVWSWHIWVSVTHDQTWGREFDNTTLSSMSDDFSTTYHTFLDRNIGATFHPADKGVPRSTGLSSSSAYYVDGAAFGQAVSSMTAAEATAACGYLYQYGRPVPLPSRNEASWGQSGYEGGGDVTDETAATNKDGRQTNKDAFSQWTADVVFSPYYEGYGGWEMRNMNAGREEMAAWPNVFNKVIEGGENYQRYQASWANDIHVTGAEAEWAETKTDNDPCPPGYRVPTKKELYIFKVDGVKYPWPRRSDWSGVFPPETGETLGWYYFLRYHHPAPDYGAYTLTYRATAVPESITECLYIPMAGWRPAGGSNPRNNKYTGALNVDRARLWCFDPGDSFISADNCSFKAYQAAGTSYKTTDTGATVTVATKIDPALKPRLSQNSNKEIYGDGDMFAQYLDISSGRQVNEQQADNALLLAQSAAAFSVRCVKQ